MKHLYVLLCSILVVISMKNDYVNGLSSSFSSDNFILQFHSHDELSEIHYWTIKETAGNGYAWCYTLQGVLSVFAFECTFFQKVNLELRFPESYLLVESEDSQSGSAYQLHVGKQNSIRFSFPSGVNEKISAVILKDPAQLLAVNGTSRLLISSPDWAQIFSEGIRTVSARSSIIDLMRRLRPFQGIGDAANLWVYGILLQCLSVLTQDAAAVPKNVGRKVSDADIAHLSSVEYYIDQHYMDDISLDDLTKIACMGITKLKYTFKAQYGCTIITYLQHKRMNEAKRLLETTDHTVKEISSMVGYHSGSRFAHLFREEYGTTPLEYRKQL